MAARVLSAANLSAPFLFRAIASWGPTLLIDEADTFIRQSDELKGLVNAGHTRANAYVGRTVGDDHEPTLFNVWGAKAFAGIALEKHLPDSTLSRGIAIVLRRKLPHEIVSRLRHADRNAFSVIAEKLARFAEDYGQQIRDARPALPEQLSDRAQDNWEPLLAIAECAGPDWVQRANAAAIKLSGAADTSGSTGNQLLADIQQIFETTGVDRISTADLLAALGADGEKPWATYNHGKPLTARQLARYLSGYGIKSKTVRFGDSTPKGFELSQFADAFARYLPKRRNDSPNSIPDKALGAADGGDPAATDAASTAQEPMPGAETDLNVDVPALGEDSGGEDPEPEAGEVF